MEYVTIEFMEVDIYEKNVILFVNSDIGAGAGRMRRRICGTSCKEYL
jgi:hypothetical protein